LAACQEDFDAEFSDDEGDLECDDKTRIQANIRTETGMRLAVLDSAATNVWFEEETFAETMGEIWSVRLVVQEGRMGTRWTW
jgi:hypothetical protein